MSARDRSSLAAVDDLLDEIDELLDKETPPKARAPAALDDPADGIDRLLGDLGGVGGSQSPLHVASSFTTRLPAQAPAQTPEGVAESQYALHRGGPGWTDGVDQIIYLSKHISRRRAGSTHPTLDSHLQVAMLEVRLQNSTVPRQCMDKGAHTTPVPHSVECGAQKAGPIKPA